MARLAQPHADAAWCSGTYRYVNGDTGRLHVAKAVLTGTDPWDIEAYRSVHPDFPRTNTGRQLYSEFDFEAYRALGHHAVSRLLEQAKHDIIADPEAKNTEVIFYRNAKIDGRDCTHIQVTHPDKDEAFTFHQANIYIDNELNVPLRVETYTWPKDAGDPALLLEEYTYMKLKLNIGLTDGDFSEQRLRAAAK
mgnify:CR=1 FL=1